MPNDPGLPIMLYIGALAIGVLLFIALRSVVLWYWRINEMADDLRVIANHYRRQQAQPPPNKQPVVPPQTTVKIP